jgi:hypothetical protein
MMPSIRSVLHLECAYVRVRDRMVTVGSCEPRCPLTALSIGEPSLDVAWCSERYARTDRCAMELPGIASVRIGRSPRPLGFAVDGQTHGVPPSYPDSPASTVMARTPFRCGTIYGHPAESNCPSVHAVK